MIKTKIECILDFVEVNGIYNNELYYYTGGQWDSRRMATCINCGELFIYNEQELYFKKMTLKQRAAGHNCPKCKTNLDKSIENYPDSFKTKNGTIGHSIPNSIPADKLATIEVWELFVDNQ
jgi:hypothetical protein